MHLKEMCSKVEIERLSSYDLQVALPATSSADTAQAGREMMEVKAILRDSTVNDGCLPFLLSFLFVNNQLIAFLILDTISGC